MPARRVLVLCVESPKDRSLFDHLRTNFKILGMRQVFVDFLDVAQNAISTDHFKAYDLVVSLVTPDFLAAYPSWKQLAGYLEHDVVPNFPLYVRRCNFSGTFFSVKIAPWTQPLSEASSIDTEAMKMAALVADAVLKEPAQVVLGTTRPPHPTPDIALFARGGEDERLLNEILPHLTTAFPGWHIWTSWDIPAGTITVEEIQRGRTAPIQIMGLSATFLAEEFDLLRSAKSESLMHHYRIFWIALRPALYEIAFHPHERRDFLPGPNATVSESRNRLQTWIEIVRTVQAQSREKRMSPSELTDAYYNK
jgi:hypothetical protein